MSLTLLTARRPFSQRTVHQVLLALLEVEHASFNRLDNDETIDLDILLLA